jgi:hypothetical protein
MAPAFAADEPLCVPEPVEEKYRIAMAHLSLIQGKPEFSGRLAFSRLAQRKSPSKNDCARRADLLALKARSYDLLSVFPPAQKEAFYLTQSRRFHSASFQSVIAAVSPMSIGRICRMAVQVQSYLKRDLDAAAALMKPTNEDVLISRPVNKAVGNVKNNGPELLEKA